MASLAGGRWGLHGMRPGGAQDFASHAWHPAGPTATHFHASPACMVEPTTVFAAPSS